MTAPRCRCGARWPSHGLAPPAVKTEEWWCGVCIQFQPATQAAIARRAREAIEGEE